MRPDEPAMNMLGTDSIYACVYCGQLKYSFSGTGGDIACCGEVGHVELCEVDPRDQYNGPEQDISNGE
jgi:hypothetical protein